MSRREPIFNVPRVVVWLLAAFFAVHIVRLLLPEYQDRSHGVMDVMFGSLWQTWAVPYLPDSLWLTTVLAFIPARLGGLASDLPGGDPAIVTSFATHIFVHGDIMHLSFNSAWLLAFGTPIAWRLDTARFLLFFLMAGAAGALFFTAVHGFELTMLIGASGAISGLMGAAFRFIFGKDEHGLPSLARGARWAPLMSLRHTLRERRIVMAVAGWVILNVLVGWGAAASLTEASSIAWEAHLGGFAAGLLTYGFFERPRVGPPTNEDAAGAA
ncbi:MAG TPA: rhomboid family intramembrane serine protease [Hyphomicrobiaceae bacterium]|nr:rhomboid family intramembrane serine protease [Hyphomicrobiaceae bacterium]